MIMVRCVANLISGIHLTTHMASAIHSSSNREVPLTRVRLWLRCLDPFQCWEDRWISLDNPKFPELKYKRKEVARWIDDLFHPSWVMDDVVAAMNARTRAAEDSVFWIDPAISRGLDKGVVLSNPVHLFVGHCSGRGRTSAFRMPFERRLRKEGKAEFSGACWDVRRLCKEGRLKEALQILDFMDQEGIQVRTDTYVFLLQGCIHMKALAEGKKVHAHIIKSGLKPNVFLGNVLVNMYAKCGSVIDAWQAFEKMPKRDVVSWTGMIAGYAYNGHGVEALKLFWQMQQEGVMPNEVTFAIVLNACTNLAALEVGKTIHACIIASGFETDAYVGKTLVGMYAKCGSTECARQVFNTMLKRDVVSWTAMIGGYAQHCQGEEALKLFWQMQQESVKPNKVTFISVLQACSSLAALGQGKLIHAFIIKSGFEFDVFVGNALMDMYVKCGSIEHAWQVFNEMPKRDVVSWSTMIRGYFQYGHDVESLNLFWQMQQENVKPNRFTVVTLLSACANLAALEHGKEIHSHILKSGFESDIYVENALVDMYAKCGSIKHAHQVFNKILNRDVVSWTAMIGGYAQHGHGKEALKLFEQMQQDGVKPNSVTFVIALQACASQATIGQGKWVHACIIKSGFELDAFVGNALIDMYAKCGSIVHARQTFDKMAKQDVVSWTTMIGGYAQHGNGEEALELFWQMQQESVKPNKVTFINVLNACASLKAVEQGKQIHVYIMNSGFESDALVKNSLVDMYAKCGSIGNARQLFDKVSERGVVLWTLMISGYAQKGHGEEALELFRQMQWEGLKPDEVTFVSVLNACTGLASLEQGKQIHAHIIKAGFESDLCLGNVLVDMYAKCGSIKHACQMFYKIPKRDVFSWTAMIGGYAQHGHAVESLRLFWQMQRESVKPDEVTFVNILNACASLAALDQGKQIHAYIIKSCFEFYIVVENALVNMYAKCGSLEHAHAVFDKMPERDVVSWTAMIAGYAQHDCGEDALKLFQQMQQLHVEPNRVTYIGVLKACASLAALGQGKQIHAFIIMSELETDVFMGNSLIDMYAKCGSIEHACRVFERMPKRDVVSWNVMIAGYAQHGKGEEAFQLFLKLQCEGGVELDRITFIGVLSACSHVGLVEEGCYLFDIMNRDHGLTPIMDHYVCIVDLLGRVGHLKEAVEFIKGMPFEPVAAVWITLLGACRIHGHMKLAKYATECALELEPQNDAAFVLLSNIYAAASSWMDKAEVRKLMMDRGVKKEPGCSYIEVYNQVHTFVAEDVSHP